MDGSDALSVAFGGATVAWEPSEVEPGLWLMSMRTDRSLQEYLRIHLRLPVMPDIRQLSSVFDFVADAAPGVKEVLAVGKVCWEVRENHYDIVIVDAEASGHVVAQIASPRTINSLVPRGPLRDQTRWMLGILDDPARCGVVIVTTPEELPVTETMELAARLASETRTTVAAVVVNAAEPGTSAAAETLASDPWFVSVAPGHAQSVAIANERHREQTEALGPLASLGVPALVLPACAGTEPEIVAALTELVKESIR